ncbi:MAG TPA: tetratricopeptide repeat protein, partial [Phycisphaeraceae bacterium]
SVIVGYARSLIASGQTTRAQELLAPLLGRSSDWRLAWIRLAMLAMPDPATAKAWLERVSPYVADDAVDEQVTLAQSWWLLADRFQRPDFRQPARQIVERIIQQPNASAQAWHMRALMAEHQQDAATAQASYRKALELNPDLHVARNNLAMLLAQDDQSLDEALQLAQQVVAAVPNSPPFLDTLAYIQARAHQCDAAIQNMQQAIQLDPQNPVWRENLAKILAMCGQQERESELLQTIHAATQPSE